MRAVTRTFTRRSVACASSKQCAVIIYYYHHHFEKKNVERNLLPGIAIEKSKVVDSYDLEISKYAYQSLQPHQDAVIKEAEKSVELLSEKVKNRKR